MTIGWILERDRENFFAGTERVKKPAGPPTPSFACPFCGAHWAQARELQAHIAVTHFVARPILIIDGVEPARSTILRKRPIKISVLNSSQAELKMGSTPAIILTPEELVRQVALLKQAEVSISLANAALPGTTPVITPYSLSFRIVAPATMRGVEMAFTEQLASGELTRALVGQFLQDRRCLGDGRDYAARLAEFALGILLKERPAGEALTLPFAAYRECYGAALEALAEFDRPLARLVTSVIRFAINDFGAPLAVTGYWDLDLVRAMLANPGDANPPSAPVLSANRLSICPVDHGTGQILDLGVRMFSQPRWSPILSDECRQAATSALVDEMDRQKALAVWAAASWRLGAKMDAEEPLRQISAIHPFRSWAEPYLESLTS